MSIGNGRLRTQEELKDERIRRLERQLVESRLEVEKQREENQRILKERPVEVEFHRRGCHRSASWQGELREMFYNTLHEGYDIVIKDKNTEFVLHSPMIKEINVTTGEVNCL